MVTGYHPRKITQTLGKITQTQNKKIKRKQEKTEENKTKTKREKKAIVGHLKGQLSVRTELGRPERAPHDTVHRLGGRGASGSSDSRNTRLQ